MKKITLTLLILVFAVQAFAEGIHNAAELVEFANAVNSGQSMTEWRNADGEICLEADIDMSKAKKFKGIASFSGIFNGKGHCIKGWKATGGLFHVLEKSAIVENLVIDGSCRMKAENKEGDFAAGFIADINNGTIRFCSNAGKITHNSSYTDANILVGGIAGVNMFVIRNCSNSGDISSDCLSTKANGNLIAIGGIAGGNLEKSVHCAVITRCENTGAVSYNGDFPEDYIGGITGRSLETNIKFSINRGSVFSRSTASGEFITSRVAGICGFCKADIVSCDNFGSVSTEGTTSASVAGIIGMPHSRVNITDCCNYGVIAMRNDIPGYAGGIAGNIGRPVHVRQCINSGDVVFEGLSVTGRSGIGGIVGNIYVTKDAVEGAYIRNCLNTGKIRSGKGGNGFTDDRAVHTGGIVGFMQARNGVRSFLLDCSNEGEVIASGGRRGSIAGACQTGVFTGGAFPRDYAEAASVMSDGSNVFGRVTDTEGNPVPGVAVSDGFRTVLTDGFGYYGMKSDMDKVHFVQISVPAGYRIPVENNSARFFKRVPRYSEAVMADFRLEKRTEVKDDYTLLMIADPQIRPYGMDNSAEAWRDPVSTDVNSFIKTVPGEVYAIDLGDLVYNFMAAWDDFMDTSNSIECPMFNVLGNHDYDQETLFGSEEGMTCYEAYAGPANYSFNIGKIHYIVLSTIVYEREIPSQSYLSGLSDSSLEWLRSDLASVPEETTLVVSSHAQLFKKPTSHSSKNKHYTDYRDLLKRYRKVYTWAGHYHSNYSYDYAGKGLDMDNISCVTVSRCTGALRFNDYLNSDGVPQGYVVVNVKGDNLDWWYKSVGKEKSEQMRVYSPAESGQDGYVLADVWNYSGEWGQAEWWENGVKVADMEAVKCEDPDYLKLFGKVTNKTTQRYCSPSVSDRMFRVKPGEGVVSGEVRIKDQFGNEWKAEVSW